MRAGLNKLRNSEASEIAEAALVMPVVFIFLLGIIWFGRAFNIYSTITQAAQQGAIVAARPTCATCLAPGNPWGGNFQGDQNVVNTVYGVMQASSLDTSQIISSATTLPPAFCQLPSPLSGSCSTGSSNITVCREVLLNPGSTSPLPVCGSTVSFRYPIPLYVPFTSLTTGSFTVSADAQSRMEN